MTALSRRHLLFGAAGLLAPAAPALADNGSGKSTPKPAPPAPIGVLLPLSGDQSLVGDECLRGITLAMDAVNQAGGIASIPVRLAPADAFGQANAAQALINTSHVALILGSGTSATSFAGSAAAEIAQLPYIELNAPADGIMTRGFKFLLRTGLTTTMIADTAIGIASKNLAGKKIGLLFNTGATAGAIAAAALAAMQAAKITPLLSAGYPADLADLTEPVARFKRAGVEVLLHAADPADVLMVFAALQSLAWKPAIIGCGHGYLLRETAYALGDAFEGIMVAGAPFYPPAASAIAAAYQARYAMPPRSPDSLTTYAGAKLVFNTLNQAGGDVTKLLAALRKTDLASGGLANGWGAAFDKTGQNTRSFAAAQQWKSGALVPLT
jgi:branched-chain amino acid transport system substrate-binding protein